MAVVAVPMLVVVLVLVRRGGRVVDRRFDRVAGVADEYIKG